jgi:hypothetical protein
LPVLEPVPTPDDDRSAGLETALPPRGERRRSSDAYVDQLRTLLAKASERVRAAEQATEAAQRELASVRARLAEEIASSAVLTEMAGEAERRAMKAEATAESLRAHFAGERPVPPSELRRCRGRRPALRRCPPVPAAPVVPSARQALDGLVNHLHALPSEPAAAVGAPLQPVGEPATAAQTSSVEQPASRQSVEPGPVDAAPMNSASPVPPLHEPVAAEPAPIAAGHGPAGCVLAPPSLGPLTRST